MRSEAQKRADKKYNDSGKNQYKTIGTSLHIKQIEEVRAAADSLGLTVSKFLALSALYCAKNQIPLDKSE